MQTLKICASAAWHCVERRSETERETGEEGSNMKVQAQQTSQEPKRVQTKSTFL